MAKVTISVRIAPELLRKKPANLSTTDWITECIHVWELEKNNVKDELLKRIDTTLKEIEQIKKELNVQEAVKAIMKLEELSHELENVADAIDTALRKVNQLDRAAEKLRRIEENICQTFVCKIPAYHRDW